jgi:hypothetical protein
MQDVDGVIGRQVPRIAGVDPEPAENTVAFLFAAPGEIALVVPGKGPEELRDCAVAIRVCFNGGVLVIRRFQSRGMTGRLKEGRKTKQQKKRGVAHDPAVLS